LYLFNLYTLRCCRLNLVFLILLPSVIIILQDDPLLELAEGQQEQENASATDMTSIRNSIIPQAEEVNKSNLELIKICTASPNTGCDNTMIIIHNDCIAYPAFVATHIPSCNDSRLFSYLIARGLSE
jgi:hypothetical protein